MPEKTYLDREMKVKDAIKYFEEFYKNFDSEKAKKLLKDLDLDINTKISKMSKGMQEKLQLILVMSRNAKLYILDEPLGGVDPATREDLDLDINTKISKMSKGMQEKLQLILVMSREAELYILDEPLGGVDPATRDYILDTILSNFGEGASVIISTHLISDIERVLDEVIFIDKGEIKIASSADELRNKENASIDEIFRRYFKC